MDLQAPPPHDLGEPGDIYIHFSIPPGDRKRYWGFGIHGWKQLSPLQLNETGKKVEYPNEIVRHPKFIEYVLSVTPPKANDCERVGWKRRIKGLASLTNDPHTSSSQVTFENALPKILRLPRTNKVTQAAGIDATSSQTEVSKNLSANDRGD